MSKEAAQVLEESNKIIELNNKSSYLSNVKKNIDFSNALKLE